MDLQRPCAGTNSWCSGKLWEWNEALWEAYTPMGARILGARRGDSVFYRVISVRFEFRSDGSIHSCLLSLAYPATFCLLLYHDSQLTILPQTVIFPY